MRYRFLRYPEGKFKAFTLSYDDGVKQDKRLVEILDKYGIKCTFNINSSRLGAGESNLSVDDIKSNILKKGHEVAVHGASHKAPGISSPIDGITDVLECRKTLEKEFGGIIRGMAYPDSGIRNYHNNSSYEIVKNYLTYLGIVYARTLGGDNNLFHLPEDWHSWMPTAHHNNPQIFEFIEQFNKINENELYSASRFPRLFYLWGHSYEFDNNKNWDRIEKICQEISGKEDIWYATNIEIYNYVTAYNSLIASADGNTIYNPTLYKIWFDVDGRLYSIESGETINIE